MWYSGMAATMNASAWDSCDGREPLTEHWRRWSRESAIAGDDLHGSRAAKEPVVTLHPSKGNSSNLVVLHSAVSSLNLIQDKEANAPRYAASMRVYG